MYYEPHILQKRIDASDGVDEYGRPLPPAETNIWEDVCGCRCDHAVDKEIKLEDGTPFRPEYHIVCGNNNPDVKVNDYIRCISAADGSVKGEGRATRPHRLNYLPYAELYI